MRRTTPTRRRSPSPLRALRRSQRFGRCCHDGEIAAVSRRCNVRIWGSDGERDPQNHMVRFLPHTGFGRLSVVLSYRRELNDC